MDKKDEMFELHSEPDKKNKLFDLYSDLEEFPLLEDIIKKGDPDIIESSRQAFEKAETDDGDFEPYLPETTQQESSKQAITTEQLEELVDDIIKIHTENMRRDLLEAFKQMLEHSPTETGGRL